MKLTTYIAFLIGLVGGFISLSFLDEPVIVCAILGASLLVSHVIDAIASSTARRQRRQRERFLHPTPAFAVHQDHETQRAAPGCEGRGG